MVENGGYLCESCGGGSSNVGRFEAADLRAVKLGGAPNGSMLETIPGCWTAAAARLNDRWRGWPGGVQTSVSVVGGVVRVLLGGITRGGDDALLPGQY